MDQVHVELRSGRVDDAAAADLVESGIQDSSCEHELEKSRLA